MDRALLKNYRTVLGKVVTAYQAVKDGSRYYCLGCGEELLLRKGGHNKHHFAHGDSSKAVDADCEMRISNIYSSYSTPDDRQDIERIKQWYTQSKINAEVYNPHIPDFLFNKSYDSTWKTIANALVEELNSDEGKRFDQESFTKYILNNLDFTHTGITRYLLDEERVDEADVLAFYWELFLRFKILYRLYRSRKKLILEGYYKTVVEYIQSSVSVKPKDEKYPFEIFYNGEELNIFHDKKPVGYSNAPYDFSYKKLVTVEVRKMKELQHVICRYNEFTSAYETTNEQISFGSDLLIIGHLSKLKSLSQELEQFSQDEIIITPSIPGFAENWGLIQMTLVQPASITLAKCPNWIAWRYVELSGGLRLKKQDQANTFMRSCPPSALLNANIPSNLLSVHTEDGKEVQYSRVNNRLLFNSTTDQAIVIQIKDTPYSVQFTLCEPEVSSFVSPQNGWVLHSKWSIIADIESTSEPMFSGVLTYRVLIEGENTRKKSKECEWFEIHSGDHTGLKAQSFRYMMNNSKHLINRSLRSSNVFW